MYSMFSIMLKTQEFNYPNKHRKEIKDLMFQLWGKIYMHGKIFRDAVISSEDSSNPFDECLRRLCADFDLEKPVLLSKHEKELKTYSLTTFRADDFIDSFPYEKLEVEIISRPKK